MNHKAFPATGRMPPRPLLGKWDTGQTVATQSLRLYRRLRPLCNGLIASSTNFGRQVHAPAMKA